MKIDFNSSENQKTKGDFVNREVYCCASSLIYQLQEDGHYRDEIMEFSYKEGLREEDLKDELKKEYKEELKEYLKYNFNEDCLRKRDETTLEDLNEEELYNLANEIGILEDFQEPIEAYEHWIVSDWLADKLASYGELTTKDFLGLTIWGRCCTGQAILLDSVISHICNDLNMLK